jgi:hypothetical protein
MYSQDQQINELIVMAKNTVTPYAKGGRSILWCRGREIEYAQQFGLEPPLFLEFRQH